MKKVLIITYYWPPSGGAGVQRWLKISKYLPEFGWEPVVYTPENPEAPVDDPSLLDDIRPETEIIKRPIWEPYGWYKKFLGIRKEKKINAGFLAEEEKPKFKEKIAVWIRGNFFIPDARVFWVRPSIQYLKSYLKDNPVDLVITTGPPHSMHLIGLGLKKHLNIHWVADFRDPWTQIDFYDQLYLTGMADRKHRRLEKRVLRLADRVITIGETSASLLKKIAGRDIDVIYNGYDTPDFANSHVIPDKKFSIIHVGAMNRDRNHMAFWRALGELVSEDDGFAESVELRLIGKTDYSVNTYIARFGLEQVVTRIEYMPHEQIAGVLQSAHLLYLPINNTPNSNLIVTGKVFEYMASGRPVLGTGPPEGDSANILTESGSGTMIDFHNYKGVKEALLAFYADYKNGKWSSVSPPEEFSRRNLTNRLVDILNEISS